MAKNIAKNDSLGMSQVRRFVPGAKISAVALLLTSTAVACIYGVQPFIAVGREMRGLITLVWLWNVAAFLVCSGMVLWGWLVDRYGDRVGEDKT